jgi:hypothetical protein
MGFIQPCFIRKNTPELRKKLEELGYLPPSKVWYDEDFAICAFWRDNNGEYLIYEIDDDFERIIAPNYPFIDCGENVGLFLSLAALRDDSDYMQWFINSYGYCQFCWDKNVEDYKSGYGREMYRIIDETYHKMSAEELIEHAEIIEKRYEI